MSGQQYDNYGAVIGLWHRFTADQMLRGEPVPMPYGVHHLRNAPRPTAGMREDVRGEPRPYTLGAMPEGHDQAKRFDNQLDQALLLVDYIQTRTRVFELIDELEIMTEKLADIALGLEWSSMHGTHYMTQEIMTTRTRITDPMKAVMAIRVMTTDTTHEPEGGEKKVKGVEEPLTLE